MERANTRREGNFEPFSWPEDNVCRWSRAPRHGGTGNAYENGDQGEQQVERSSPVPQAVGMPQVGRAD
jgi:hypothetical protein